MSFIALFVGRSQVVGCLTFFVVMRCLAKKVRHAMPYKNGSRFRCNLAGEASFVFLFSSLLPLPLFFAAAPAAACLPLLSFSASGHRPIYFIHRL